MVKSYKQIHFTLLYINTHVLIKGTIKFHGISHEFLSPRSTLKMSEIINANDVIVMMKINFKSARATITRSEMINSSRARRAGRQFIFDQALSAHPILCEDT